MPTEDLIQGVESELPFSAYKTIVSKSWIINHIKKKTSSGWQKKDEKKEVGEKKRVLKTDFSYKFILILVKWTENIYKFRERNNIVNRLGLMES